MRLSRIADMLDTIMKEDDRLLKLYKIETEQEYNVFLSNVHCTTLRRLEEKYPDDKIDANLLVICVKGFVLNYLERG